MSREESPPVAPPDRLERGAGAPTTGQVHVFAIYDAEHDRDLYELLHAQYGTPGYGFMVMGGSEEANDTDAWRARVRRRIAEADQVIVICGEHADASPRIHTELLIARDEEKPYFLLWGRRGVMCTKPVGTKPAEAMYSWTRQFLYDQISFNLRKASTDAKARSLRRVTPNAKMPPGDVTSRHEASPDPKERPIR